MRFCIPALLLLTLALTGCITDTRYIEQAQKVEKGDFILSATNTVQGSVYQLRVYVIARGDSAAKIAKQFQISLSDLRALNPEIHFNHLYIGQKIRIYEELQANKSLQPTATAPSVLTEP
ncbi:MAG: LysM peptidoglycan-binding domain-containing protein [Verrucomicrobiota bacterium]|jgi:LysM repeat protein